MSSPLLLEKLLADVAFWVCFGSVLLFAYSRFNISLPDTDELSPPLEPRSFTTAFRFQLAAFTYVGLYAGVYFALTLAGAFPWIQDVVKQLFGSLNEAGSDGVGTPAWAALVATSILPSTPGFRWVDERWRFMLHEFASIPSKARMLGREILKGLPYAPPEKLGEGADLKTVTRAIERHKERYAKLCELAESLAQIDAGRVSRRYRTFFAAHQAVVDKIAKEFSLAADECKTLASARYVEERFRTALRKAARFLACAMLHAEPSEYAIRSRLKQTALSVRIVGFDFRPGHLVIVLTTIALMTLVGCYAAATGWALSNGKEPLAVLAQHSPRFFSWVFVTVLTYALPIVLAAGVEMYLLDRASAGEPVESADYASVAILTFIGAAGLAFFALLSYKFVMVRIVAPPQDSGAAAIAVWKLLPWSLPPAMIATVFLVMAGREPRLARGLETALDAGTHGAAAALASTLAMFLSAMAGQGAPMPDGMLLWIAPITAAAIGASIGGVLCTTCRHRLHTPKAPAPPAPAPGALQPAGAF